jgi:hypothetical protein
VAAVLVGEAHNLADNQEVAKVSHVVSLAASATAGGGLAAAAVVCAVEEASLAATSSSFSTLLPGLVLRPGRPASAPPPSSAVASSWLDSSLAETVLRRYRRNWDDWCSFAASHRVSALPPDETALEFYISNLVESSRSVSSVDMAKASIAHFCARGRFQSPFDSPYFCLLLRGIRNECARLPVPRLPFSADHIRKFLDLTWASECDLKLWRGVLGHVVCFQQLVRIGEVASVTGANI